MKIVVTGGAGFLGSHLCDFFIGSGDSVICIDNLITGSLENIKQLLKNPRFTFVKQDVTKYLDIAEAIDYVLHFASPASPVDYQKYPIQTLKVGSLGTHNSLGLAKSKGAGFLLASTSEVYGDPLVNPQTEKYWGNVNPIGPRGVYDEAKRFAEALTMAYHRTHKLDTKIVRIFNTYGPRMRLDDGRVIPTFISQIFKGEPLTVFGNGTQTRSFGYYSDLVEGVIKLMKVNFHEPVNIGRPGELTILQLAQLLLKITGAKNKIVFKPLPENDPKLRQPDISLARKILSWEPKVTLEEGFKKTIEHFKTIL
jgi:dTDP-glucose 4,6-dehydratase